MITSLDHDHSDSLLDLRETLWKKVRNINFGGSWALQSDEPITETLRSKLHNAVTYFSTITNEAKITILQSFVYVYTNRYAVRDELLALEFGIRQITTVKVNRPLGSVKSNDDTSKLRCYLKQLEITDKEHHLLKSFIDTNVDVVKPSLGLEHFFNRKNDRLIRNYFFLDFTEESLLTTLELMTPNLIRKVAPIVR